MNDHRLKMTNTRHINTTNSERSTRVAVRCFWINHARAYKIQNARYYRRAIGIYLVDACVQAATNTCAPIIEYSPAHTHTHTSGNTLSSFYADEVYTCAHGARDRRAVIHPL
ncbi:unnamed protein product [Trichogramma brassicae]|uniref:Uncharacterized protein n=1 Tax=Trichogramma brassicae TaxID=86971 RepID=A0A6H5HW73_9HYME|nr:unnamed protein product [Trichogramma brassicae]